MGKNILCLDFDGVCHSYISGWKGASVIPDEPVSGLFEFIRNANEEFDVQIFSARSNQEGGLQAMKDWFEKYEPGITKLLKFPLTKPPAFIGIDDRVITFQGIWPSIEFLVNFQTWNKRTV